MDSGFQGVGQGHGQQAAHFIVDAFINEAMDVGGCDKAPGCIVHQDPIMRLNAIWVGLALFEQLAQAVEDRLRSGGTAEMNALDKGQLVRI
jgi:hypothetical protein